MAIRRIHFQNIADGLKNVEFRLPGQFRIPPLEGGEKLVLFMSKIDVKRNEKRPVLITDIVKITELSVDEADRLYGDDVKISMLRDNYSGKQNFLCIELGPHREMAEDFVLLRELNIPVMPQFTPEGELLFYRRSDRALYFQ